MAFNVARSAKTSAATIADFHPYKKKRRKAMTAEQLRSLKPMFQKWKS